MKNEAQMGNERKIQNLTARWNSRSGVKEITRITEKKTTDFERTSNIFLIQNLKNAPPGRSPRTAVARGHPPENKAGLPRSVPLSFKREGPGVSLVQTTHNTIFIKYSLSIQYKTQNNTNI